MDFPGYSIGGLAVGESHEEMNAVLAHNAALTREQAALSHGSRELHSLIDGAIRE